MAKNGTLPSLTKEILREMGNIFGTDNVKAGLQQTLESYQKQGGALVAQLMALHDVPEADRPPHNAQIAEVVGNDNCWDCQVTALTKAIRDGEEQVKKMQARIVAEDIFG